MFGRAISALQRLGPHELRRQTKIHEREYKLRENSPFPSFVRIKVGDSFTRGLFSITPRDYIISNIFRDFKIYSGEEMKLTIENRLNSTYQIKESSTSTWEMYRDGTHSDGDENSEFDDNDYVKETYYAIVDAKDIRKFVKESGEMMNGKDHIDPLSDGKFHAVSVYVISEQVFPKGLEELVKRMKECRNKSLHLYVTEKGAKEFIEG